MKQLIRVLKACADPNRMRILKMLQARELCVCEITEALNIAQPSVSRHMRILEDAGLVLSRREGPWINYQWNPVPENPYAPVMLEHLRTWLEEDPEIRRLLEETANLDRNEICGRLQGRPQIGPLKESRP